ncbi:hypothetical protein [Planctomicrobium sp. SH527]|uniref:hypothetical protein n=1 Tax=Planctomicrobium sp. SH527 TaxID=3448123 RepID=UPI003F5C4B2F
MTATRDHFEFWLFEMDDCLAEFICSLPTDISAKLDYSADSLSILETWLLSQYENVHEILKDPEKLTLDMAARYVGETFRKKLGGIWNIDLKNKKNVYYRMPVIERSGSWIECPITLVTASTDRRSGNFMAGVLNSLASRYGTVE